LAIPFGGGSNGTLAPILRQRQILGALRHAIDNQREPDPALLEALKSRPRLQPHGIMLTGAIVPAVGAGLVSMAFLVEFDQGRVVWPLVGVGAMLVFIGVALIGYAKWLKHQQTGDRAGE
jgi:hypothetical protein